MKSEAEALDIEIRRKRESFKQRLSFALKALPPNPGTIRINKSCAAVPFSQIRSRSLNLSAKYHLFEGTYDELSRIIERSNLTQIKQLIEGILKGGTYRNIDDRKMVRLPQQIKMLWES